MSDKKDKKDSFKTFCRIIDYVESIDSDLAEILHGTCTDYTLSSLKGKNGITFLMPVDPKIRKKLADLAYSDKVEDSNKACDMINAMIMRDVFKTSRDWLDKKDDIPNSLYPAQLVEIESASGKEVKFKNGATAVIDESFRDSSKKTNLAVWKLTGEIPVTTDKPAKMKYSRKNTKTGSYQVNPAMESNIRYKIGAAVENFFLIDRIQNNMKKDIFGGGSSDGQVKRNVFVENILSLVNYIMKSDMDLFYNRVLPLLSFQSIDFYNLIEPHRFKEETNYLIPTSVISEWWSSPKSQLSQIRILKNIDDALGNAGKFSQAKVYTDRAGIIKETDKIRRDLLQSAGTQSRTLADKIIAVYNKLNDENAIGGLQGIYPDSLAEYFAAESSLKIMQDELRYSTFLMIEDMDSQIAFDRNHFNVLIDHIAEYMFAITSTERERTLKMLNPSILKYMISPVNEVNKIVRFVNSTYFLYTPITLSEMQNYPLKNVIVPPNPQEIKGIWLIDQYAANKYKRIAASTPEQEKHIADLADRLKDVDTANMDPDLRQAILDIYNKIKE